MTLEQPAEYPQIFDLPPGITLPPVPAHSVLGQDPVVRTPYQVGRAAATALQSFAMALEQLWQDRGGNRQAITTDIVDATISCYSVNHQRQNGYEVALPDPIYPTVDFYRTKDDRSIFLHGGYPALRNGLLDLLDSPNNAKALAKRVAAWPAEALEDAIAEANLCGTILRTAQDWRAHPQGQALANTLPIEWQQLGTSSPEPLPPAVLPNFPSKRPLEGVRVLDLTHVLAGPTATRCLAEHGADVLSVRAPQQPQIESFVMDTGHGKRATYIDLTTDQGRAALDALVCAADIWIESYAPGALEKLGYGPERLAELRPGLITVQISCYGFVGPWQNRKGWEQLAQTCSGLAAGTNGLENPGLVPNVYPNDYITGYLAANAALLGLLFRAQQGGSWNFQTALTRTAMWIEDFGTLPDTLWPAVPPIPEPRINALRQSCQSAWGLLRYIGPVTRFSETPGYFARPSVPLGHDQPVWLPRV